VVIGLRIIFSAIRVERRKARSLIGVFLENGLKRKKGLLKMGSHEKKRAKKRQQQARELLKELAAQV